MNLDTSEAYTFVCRKCFKDLDKLVRLKKKNLVFLNWK